MSDNSGIVDNLVTQFASPLDCFRELAQNAMDAGSPVVEVWTEFIPGEDYIGTIALHVDDWGEGMDEQIIDTYLTQLFSSSKEDDLTKIGKFGIGFVSVFALNPRAVLIQTGRGGEYWEVLFHHDRTFNKTPLQMPVEGTQITIFVAGDIQRYGELARGIRERLTFWCAHSETEITFEDRTPISGASPELVAINTPFGIEGHCVTRVEHQGTEIVCAYQSRPSYGFYNAGLTLAFTRAGEDVLGERAARFRHIGFKIKSRYLEHTLSRDTIMRDENYEKAMRLLVDAANRNLFAQLLDELKALLAQSNWGLSQVQAYGDLLRFLAAEPYELLKSAAQIPLIRTLGGDALSLGQVYEFWSDNGRVLMDAEPGELSGALQNAGTPVVYGVHGAALAHPIGAVNALLERFVRLRYQDTLGARLKRFTRILGTSRSTQHFLVSPEDVYLPVSLDTEAPAHTRALIDQAAGILGQVNAGYRRLVSCQMVHYDENAQLFVVAPKLSSYMARPPRQVASSRARLEAAVNRDHPHFIYLLRVHQTHPRLAAYCLAKSLLLTEDRLLHLDLPIIAAAQALRPAPARRADS